MLQGLHVQDLINNHSAIVQKHESSFIFFLPWGLCTAKRASRPQPSPRFKVIKVNIVLVLVVFLQKVKFGANRKTCWTYSLPGTFKTAKTLSLSRFKQRMNVHSFKFMLRHKAWSCDITKECLSAFVSHPCESKNLVKSLCVGVHVTYAAGNSNVSFDFY